MWDLGSKIWDLDLVKNLRHRDAKLAQNKILTEIWRSGQNLLRPMCFEDYIISILYPYIWSKGNKLFIYKIIKPPGEEIFRPQIWPIVHVMHTLIDITVLYPGFKGNETKNSWIQTKETWGGILCCLMNWTKGSRQMLQCGN